MIVDIIILEVQHINQGHVYVGIENIQKKTKYYEDHEKQILQRQKQYYEENKDKISKRQKQYNDQNKNKRIQYYENNKEKITKYYQEHKDVILSKVNCPCGGKYTLHKKHAHEKTKRHIQYLSSQTEEKLEENIDVVDGNEKI